MTSQQLVTLIILIVSFSIILIFFFVLDLTGTIDEESCRNSVSMRGAFSFLGQSLITLKCPTKDVCISFGGGCGAGFSNDATNIEVQSKGELTSEVGKLIKNCWWMMGEGNSKYSSNGCAICYNIKFGEDVLKQFEGGQLPYSQIYNSLAVTPLDNSDESVLFYMYNLNSIESVRNKLVQDVDIDIQTANLDLTKEYAVVTSVNDDNFIQPVLVEFSGASLKSKFSCSEYVTEI